MMRRYTQPSAGSRKAPVGKPVAHLRASTDKYCALVKLWFARKHCPSMSSSTTYHMGAVMG